MDTAAATTADPLVTVKDAILRLFPTYDALEGFLRTNLGLWLNQITDRTLGLDVVAFKLVRWATSDDGGKALVARLAQCYPTDTTLTDLVAALGIDPAVYPPRQAAFTGLEAAAADPTTRRAFAPYSLDLQHLCDLSIQVRDWKFLHDAVDQIRNGSYNPLLAHADSSPMAKDKAEEIQWLTNGWVASIVERAGTMNLTANDMIWIERRLKPANDKLAVAAKAWPAKPEYDFVMAMLSVVTSSDLGHLNAMIITKADSIAQLNILGKIALLKVDLAAPGGARDAGASADKDMSAVEDGLTAMLERNAIHDRWQKIKDELAPLRTAPDRNNLIAQMAWEILDPLLAEATDRPPLTDLIRSRITEAFADPQVTNLAESVGKLAGIVDQQFFAVDKDLLVATEALGQIGSGLKKVLDILHG